MTIKDMQNLNRDTIKYISSVIKAGMNLCEVRNLCEKYLLSNGADSFWYWDVGAFVFCGKETAVSVSGREYRTSDIKIEENDIITIDLSPQNNNIWGDYARTIIIENGNVVTEVEKIQNEEWRNGLIMEEYLHKAMQEYVTVDTTFEELYYHINKIIIEKGYVNLDFMGNLGHSIVMNKNDRIYIEKGNKAKLSSVKAFTFEPHISVPNSHYGYKMENIYSFNNDKLIEE
ncbi:MAG: aminopeptidase P family protein [Ruminococcus sp.]|nr:aminopeptidase P family protein [Ruminococcus sp.]